MPKKPKLGQNFLIDEAACLRIANSLGDLTGRTVVEVGPGHGAITQHLAARAARLHCIELDRSLARELAFRFREAPHVTIHNADILQTDLRSLSEESDTQVPLHNTPAAPSLSSFRTLSEAEGEESTSQPPRSPTLDLIGNLPYYITSDILLHLYAAARAGVLGRAVVMMQREVAERIAAAPGSSDYGALSAFTQMHTQPSGGVAELFTLPPAAFDPPPDVFSTVLRLHFAPRFTQLGVDPEGFNRFLRSTFAQKRKTLSNNLRTAGYTTEQLQAAWSATIPAQARAEAVPLEAMAVLYRGLSNFSGAAPGSAGAGAGEPAA